MINKHKSTTVEDLLSKFILGRDWWLKWYVLPHQEIA